MQRILLLIVIFSSLVAIVPATCQAHRNGPFAARRGPWIVYRYPLFREGNRPPEARNHGQEYYWPYDANERYPQFYGGFHYRHYSELGIPPGDRGLRGTAW